MHKALKKRRTLCLYFGAGEDGIINPFLSSSSFSFGSVQTAYRGKAAGIC